MKKERLKAVIDELTTIIDEMQTEVNDFHAKRSDWYDFHLQLFRSGLMGHEQFEREIWREIQSMHTCFGDDLYALQRLALVLDVRYESFKQMESHLQRAIDCSRPKPTDWKEYVVRFGCPENVQEEERYFAPNEDYARKMCSKHHKFDCDCIISEVKEV